MAIAISPLETFPPLERGPVSPLPHDDRLAYSVEEVASLLGISHIGIPRCPARRIAEPADWPPPRRPEGGARTLPRRTGRGVIADMPQHRPSWHLNDGASAMIGAGASIAAGPSPFTIGDNPMIAIKKNMHATHRGSGSDGASLTPEVEP